MEIKLIPLIVPGLQFSLMVGAKILDNVLFIDLLFFTISIRWSEPKARMRKPPTRPLEAAFNFGAFRFGYRWSPIFGTHTIELAFLRITYYRNFNAL
ncbi:hypothetical protein [Bacillus badius]|uniref:hypothetical protein n=1 Tax=Bacillus badius TaxID=1455 RepID=UPI0007B3DE80|nr:hypothetical protein A3781_19805 [Bacillus badius]